MSHLRNSLFRRVKERVRPTRFLDLVEWSYYLAKRHQLPLGQYFEFGVFKGASAIAFDRAVKGFFGEENLPPDQLKMYLFDSFEGLPEPEGEKDKVLGWEKGSYNSGGVENVRQILTHAGVTMDRVSFIPGYYEDSLPKVTFPEGTVAGIVNLDCDYYSSTVTALDFLAGVVRPFTLVYFDDLHAFAGNPNKGQLAAIREFNERNDGKIGLTPCPIFAHRYEGRIYWFWKD